VPRRARPRTGCQACRPAGIDDGHQIRLSGEGEAGPRGGTPGNLYVVAHVEAHPQLKREETELYYAMPVSITQAALGARLAVPTPDGPDHVDLKPGTQHGTQIRLRGKGVPHLRRAGLKGDLHVLVDVQIPTRLTARQRELLEEFAEESGEAEPVPAPGPGPKASGRSRRKRGLTDRLKDAIS